MQGHPEESFAYREHKMAININERIFQREPNAKVLVWVGYGHSKKSNPADPNKFMAQHLWELTGKEPYCAYQITGAGLQGGVDILIRHSLPKYINQRPDWLRTEHRASIKGNFNSSGEHLIQLQPYDEGESSTPIDQILISREKEFELLVPRGKYLMRLLNSDDHVVKKQMLEVSSSIDGFQPL